MTCPIPIICHFAVNTARGNTQLLTDLMVPTDKNCVPSAVINVLKLAVTVLFEGVANCAIALDLYP